METVNDRILKNILPRYQRIMDGTMGFQNKNLALEDIFNLNFFVPLQGEQHYATNGQYFGQMPFRTLMEQTAILSQMVPQKQAFKIFSKELKGAIPRAVNIEEIVL